MPSPTPSELGRWRALVSHAQLQADRPRRDARDLKRAARACRDTVLPFGGLTPGDHLFCDLKAKAEAVAERPPSERAAQAAELLRLATACARLLDGGDPDPGGSAAAAPRSPTMAPHRPTVRYPSPRRYPAPRFRADIDG